MARSHDSDSLNIVLAASEAVPYVKTGGLADVVGALPVEFAKLGHVVTLIVPRYRGFQTGGRLLRSLGSVRVQTSGGYVDAGLEEDLISVGGSGRPVRVVAVRVVLLEVLVLLVVQAYSYSNTQQHNQR